MADKGADGVVAADEVTFGNAWGGLGDAATWAGRKVGSVLMGTRCNEDAIALAVNKMVMLVEAAMRAGKGLMVWLPQIKWEFVWLLRVQA